jgi:redox-sensitive bicupin YhaK (pirin superfamily)
MEKYRKIRKLIKSEPTIEGAGVHLKRAFAESTMFDPFLLLDDFRSNNPRYYIKGFPWHPHRGIETITYVLQGSVEHGDSMGNKGMIASGDVQWMTAGSGIIHQEMPEGDEAGHMGGFQLWANLPASHKMMEPRYRDVKSDQIPEISMGNGVTIRVICGEVKGTRGPVRDIIIDPEYLDIIMPPGSVFIHPTKRGHTVFAYIIEGKAWFSEPKDTLLYNENLVLFHDGEQIVVSAENESVRFLLISGKPIGEPVAWRGPIVMNTQRELRTAFEEYSNGTFIKHKKA